jgi:hypothetical protein
MIRTEGQTDKHDKSVIFRKFLKAPKTANIRSAIWPQQGQGATKRKVSAHDTLWDVVVFAVVTANLKISTP